MALHEVSDSAEHAMPVVVLPGLNLAPEDWPAGAWKMALSVGERGWHDPSVVNHVAKAVVAQAASAWKVAHASFPAGQGGGGGGGAVEEQ